MRLLTTLSLLLLLAPLSQAQWVAGRTSVSGLSLKEMRAMMDSSLDTHPEVQFEVPENNLQPLATGTTFDWRNKDGKNYLSAIRHQGSCGSCLAFAAVGTLEAQYRITQAKTYRLSPQFIFSCGGGVCKRGWYPDQAAKFLLSTGVPDESCMPYSSGGGSDISCTKACGDAKNRSVKTSSYSRPTQSARSLAAIREALKQGPLVTTMSAYMDFMNYRRGIYKRVSNTYVGGHAIVIVGYNDQERYLIIRNSWGTSWGESGYGRISYDDTSGIGASTWKYEVAKPKVFDLPLLNASLEQSGDAEIERAPAVAPSINPPAEPEFTLTRPVQSKKAPASFELHLDNPSGFTGEIRFHQVHKNSEKVIALSLPAEGLRIRLNSHLLKPGEWEFFVSAQDSSGNTITSEKQVITIEP